MRDVKVWDLPIRLFHWALVGFVILAWVTGEEAEEGREEAEENEHEEENDEGYEEHEEYGAGAGHEGASDGEAALGAGADAGLNLHEIAGYAILALLIFRIAWGFVGSEHLRFWEFVKFGRPLADYAGALLRLAPPKTLGHNPLGGWMVVLLLVNLAALVATGVMMEGGESELLEELHEVLSNVLIGLASLHVLGVIADTLLTGERLVPAMVSGRKKRPVDDPARDATFRPLWLAGLVAALAAAATIAVIRAVTG